MSEAYERERCVARFLLRAWCRKPSFASSPLTHTRALGRQNNSRLDELSSKVSALRGVTVDIYDNARDQHVLDSSVSPPHRGAPSPRPIKIASDYGVMWCGDHAC